MARPSIHVPASGSGGDNARPNVSALRSQFESLTTKNIKAASDRTRPTDKARPSVPERKRVVDSASTKEGEEANEEDDIASNYGDDDASADAVAAEGTGRSTPEHYVDISTTNPYNEQKERRQSREDGEYSDQPVCQTVTVAVTAAPPSRAETMGETVERLARELDEAHRAIKADEEEALRRLRETLEG